ncbi:MAG: polymer-forming cytoskeletal protein [Prevotellaceae bacterium]|jgi:cytoskeletal protein CcmA (bactofilin family)|nr:polymer-forming cytoskeletal protein [Prevotellaceae bacterium]
MSKNNIIEPPVSGNVNRICEGTEINGTIKAPTDYRIDGKVEGNISCDGKVVIGDKGYIKGEIVSKNVEISGKVEGTITAESLLTLKSTAVVTGDIITNKLVVEVGAQFNGNCHMKNKIPETPQHK